MIGYVVDVFDVPRIDAKKANLLLSTDIGEEGTGARYSPSKVQGEHMYVYECVCVSKE
jgi:hypothetical protein